MTAAASGYVAYSGPYSVDEAARTVHHHVRVSLFPNWLGDTQLRFARLDGDVLVLSSPPLLVSGVEAVPELHWRRARRR